MDSASFEKCFDVATSDKIVTMQLLTADYMEELVKLQMNSQIVFDIVVKNDEMYLRFHSGSVLEAGNPTNKNIEKDLIKP